MAPPQLLEEAGYPSHGADQRATRVTTASKMQKGYKFVEPKHDHAHELDRKWENTICADYTGTRRGPHHLVPFRTSYACTRIGPSVASPFQRGCEPK